MSEYIEFSVVDMSRFEDLQKVFNKLKNDKDQDFIDEDNEYLALFDEEARKYFCWSTPEEDELWAKRWFSTPLETRWTDISLDRGWGFASMIQSFNNGEYDLLTCEIIGANVARLSFYALGYPYGGTGCMEALVESFGFKVTLIANGGEPPFYAG